MKKYVDIERLKDKYAETFEAGERIVIEEKIDFSNASFLYDEERNEVVAFSRRQELTEGNRLNGFWDWVKTLSVDKVKEVLGTRYIVFGEWAGAKHTVLYPDDVKGKFWMFDVYDKEMEQYVPFEVAREMFEKLGLEKFVPVFYDGPFTSWEDVLSFVGKSEVGASPCGEGIVVKRQEKLWSKSSRCPFYVKIVSKQFSEVHDSKSRKEIDPAKLAEKERIKEEIATVVTKRRVEKTLQKFVEDEIIPQDWDETNMREISKLLPKAMFEDCKKEEPEMVAKYETFGKVCASLSMGYAKEILADKSWTNV